MTREEYLAKRRAYYQKNKHKWSQYAKEHREQINAYCRRRRMENPEKDRAMKKAWRKKNVEKNKEYQRRYREKEGYKEKKKAYYEAHKQEFFERAKRNSKKYVNERKAQKELWNAIKRGDITQKPCEICGDMKADAHHPDYNKPLEVMWLCRKHHREWHDNNEPIRAEDTWCISKGLIKEGEE